MKNKSEKSKTLTAREAVQEFIRPYVLKGDVMALRPFLSLRHDTENYSAHISGENIILTKLNGEEIKEEFTLKEIMLDVTMEYSYSKGMANMTAATAKEAYEKRLKEVNLLLKQLNRKMNIHRDGFKLNQLNWGYVGDVAHIQKGLEELVAFLN